MSLREEAIDNATSTGKMDMDGEMILTQETAAINAADVYEPFIEELLAAAKEFAETLCGEMCAHSLRPEPKCPLIKFRIFQTRWEQ